MLFNLSIKNIRKSIKDYGIYFFTLVIAVAIFYIFNSVGSQQSMLILNNSKAEMIKLLIIILEYISVFVSVILGFLIIYSNNFLVKRRKKEFGLYLTLGMSKRKVSTILVLETLLVGLISLVVGLFVGFIGSQFLSIFAANLFEANMNDFHFTFSIDAVMKTLLYFGIIFFLVMIFNVISLSKYKLIDLLTASKKNEKVKFRNKYVVLISFIISAILLGYAYSLLFKGTFFKYGPDNESLIMIITGSLGTFFLFFSISGFLLKVFQNVKKFYYKNLNLFTLKQINSKANTTVISTTVICLMLLLTIGILSGSMSLSSVLNNDLKENNLTDFTLYSKTRFYGEANEFDLNSIALDKKFTNNIKDYAVYRQYNYDGMDIISLITEKSLKELEKEQGDEVSNGLIPIILETDYINIMKVLNKDIIDIKDDEYLVLANIDNVVDHYTLALKENNEITINNENLKPAINKVYKTAIENYTGSGNTGVIVVSDKYKDVLNYNISVMVGNYNNKYEAEEVETQFKSFLDSLNVSESSLRTKIDMEASSVGLKAILTFIGLYLGIVFAISSATVLAIGQLSESSDNKERFKVLRQLGTDEKMIKRALFTQICIAFISPLVVAIVHAVFGLNEFNNIIKTLANISLTENIILTTIFIIIVYGGYLIATYLSSKSIINEKN